MERAQVAAKRELHAHLADGRAIVAVEVSNGLEVRCQAPGEPTQLQVPMALAFQAPRRLYLVEVAID